MSELSNFQKEDSTQHVASIIRIVNLCFLFFAWFAIIFNHLLSSSNTSASSSLEYIWDYLSVVILFLGLFFSPLLLILVSIYYFIKIKYLTKLDKKLLVFNIITFITEAMLPFFIWGGPDG